MQRVLAKDLNDHSGREILVQGWLHKKRLLGGLTFINIRDRSGLVQVVIEDKKEVEKLRGLQLGTVLNVIGKAAKEERAPGGAELRQPKIEVVAPVTDESPIEIDKPLSHKPDNLDTLFDNRPIGLRNLKEQAIFRIQAEALKAIRSFLDSNGFVEMNTPKLLAEATEGGAEVFKLDYFGKEATLAQSAQFYKQMMVGVFERVYETNPTYRAEPSATTRHMTEFITIDVEMAFIEFEDLLKLTSNLFINTVNELWQTCPDELKQWGATKPELTNPIPVIPMQKVHELYSQANKTDTTKDEDLRPDEERWICEHVKEHRGTEAVFVTEWPASGMKFYHRKNAQNPDIVDRADLLFRGVEIATVPMREHRYKELVNQLKTIAKGNPQHPGFMPYLSAFKYGLPPHGGFGMGLERLTEKIIGLNNVKEATLFPRDINRLTP